MATVDKRGREWHHHQCQIAAEGWHPEVALHIGRRKRLDLVFGWAEWDAFDVVIVGDRLVPRIIEVEAPGSTEGDDPALRMTIEMVNGVPRCSLVEVKMRPGKRGVQSHDLRDVRLDEWIEHLVAAASSKVTSHDGAFVSAVIGDGADWERDARKAVRAMQRTGRRKVTAEFLSRVAAVHQVHEERPVEAVQLAFGTSYRTAARWVQKAREDGLL